jgi:hypothetical protein
MQPSEEIMLIETLITSCRLVQKAASFDLIQEIRFPLSPGNIHSILTFLESVKADEHHPHQFMHGNLFLSYAPEESSGEVTIQYGDRPMRLDLSTAFTLLEKLQAHGNF